MGEVKRIIVREGYYESEPFTPKFFLDAETAKKGLEANFKKREEEIKEYFRTGVIPKPDCNNT